MRCAPRFMTAHEITIGLTALVRSGCSMSAINFSAKVGHCPSYTSPSYEHASAHARMRALLAAQVEKVQKQGADTVRITYEGKWLPYDFHT